MNRPDKPEVQVKRGVGKHGNDDFEWYDVWETNGVLGEWEEWADDMMEELAVSQAIAAKWESMYDEVQKQFDKLTKIAQRAIVLLEEVE